MNEAAEVCRLLDAPSIGPRRAMQVLQQYGSASEASRALILTRSLGDAVADFLESTPVDEYIRVISRTHDLGGDILLWSDANYPLALREWEARPPILFFKGDISGLDENALALVGRVDPTDEGRTAAIRFARRCVDEGFAVVSGLAKGIDAASHRGALESSEGRTYAVLGHGLDYAYPTENAELYEAIPKHGALISQFRTGIGPQRWTFPARNEVMCTLALGTVIVEARPGCGSLIQTDFSFKHQRPVFVLSRNFESDDVGWANDLVGRGAHVVRQFGDVLDVTTTVRSRLQKDKPVQTQMTFETTTTIAVDEMVSLGNVERAALFDVDGVIADTRTATAAALAEIASRHTQRSVSPSEVQVAGKPHDALTRLGVIDAYAVYRAEYDAAFLRARSAVTVFGEVVTALRDLKARGIKIGAVTAQPKRRADAMLPTEVRSLFDVFLCYNDTRGRKDEGIRIALQRLGVSPDNALFVGDQPTDLQAAKSAGVRGVGVLWGFSAESELQAHQHAAIVATPEELGAALATLVPKS